MVCFPLEVENPVSSALSLAFSVTFVKSQSSGGDEIRVSSLYSFPHWGQVAVVHKMVQNNEIQGNALTPVHIFPITDDKANLRLIDEIPYPLLTQAQNGTAAEQNGPSPETLPHQLCQVLQVQLLLIRKHDAT
jgi:hypothetical protein